MVSCNRWNFSCFLRLAEPAGQPSEISRQSAVSPFRGCHSLASLWQSPLSHHPSLLCLTPSITRKLWGAWCCLSHPGFLWCQRGLAPCGSFLAWRLIGHTTGTINWIVSAPTDNPSSSSNTRWVDTPYKGQKKRIAYLIYMSRAKKKSQCPLSRKEANQRHQIGANSLLIAGHGSPTSNLMTSMPILSKRFPGA